MVLYKVQAEVPELQQEGLNSEFPQDVKRRIFGHGSSTNAKNLHPSYIRNFICNIHYSVWGHRIINVE